MMTDEKDLLIDKIHNAQPIWDKRHKQHHNRIVLAKAWKKIAAELNKGESEVKTTWKSLRQEFGRQLKKLGGRSGDAAPEADEEPQNEWPYFEKLRFLTDQFTPRRSTGNFTVEQDREHPTSPEIHDNLAMQCSDSDEGNISIETPASDTIANSVTCVNQGASASFTRTGYKKRFTTQAQIGKELINLEREKLEIAKRKKIADVNDEDVGFFNSLIPTVKTLPPKEKFQFRMKVQQILYDLAFPETAPVQAAPNPRAPELSSLSSSFTSIRRPTPSAAHLYHDIFSNAATSTFHETNDDVDYSRPTGTFLNMDDTTINSSHSSYHDE